MTLFVGVLPRCAAPREVPSPEYGVTVFESQSGAVFRTIISVGGAIAVGLLLLLVLILRVVPDVMPDFLPDSSEPVSFSSLLLFVGFLLLPAFLIGTGIWGLFNTPLQALIIVDEHERVLSLEKDCILRDTAIQVPFDDVDHLEYQYGTSGGQSYVPYGRLKLVRRDGTELELANDGEGSTHDLAEALARTTGWELKEEKRNY